MKLPYIALMSCMIAIVYTGFVCLLTNITKFSGGPGLHTWCVSFFVWAMVLIQAEL